MTFEEIPYFSGEMQMLAHNIKGHVTATLLNMSSGLFLQARQVLGSDLMAIRMYLLSKGYKPNTSPIWEAGIVNEVWHIYYRQLPQVVPLSGQRSRSIQSQVVGHGQSNHIELLLVGQITPDNRVIVPPVTGIHSTSIKFQTQTGKGRSH